MTISKEERAELAKLAAEAAKQGWNFSDPGDLGFADYVPLIAAAVNAAPRLLDALDASDERISVLESENRRALELIDVGLAETAKWQELHGRTEDRLNARIAEIEAEVARFRKLFDDAGQGEYNVLSLVEYYQECVIEAGDREDALKSRIAELEAAAQSAIFALQPTWAQDPASSPTTLGRAIAAHQESLQALAKGCDYVAASTDGYDGLVADPMVALVLLSVVGTDEDGDPKYRRIRPEVAPIPPEGEADVARLRAEVADLKAAAQWRPIEEAPKDGREVLATYGRRGQVHIADYSGSQWWKRGPGREPLVPQPTHYLPIPALPEGGANELG
jgi:hypothetical protein